MIELLALIILIVASFAASCKITDLATKKAQDLKWREWCENLRHGAGPDGLDRDGNRP